MLPRGLLDAIHERTGYRSVISEALELAKRYSTEDSHRFVNGMLARVAEEARGDRTH